MTFSIVFHHTRPLSVSVVICWGKYNVIAALTIPDYKLSYQFTVLSWSKRLECFAKQDPGSKPQLKRGNSAARPRFFFYTSGRALLYFGPFLSLIGCQVVPSIDSGESELMGPGSFLHG